MAPPEPEPPAVSLISMNREPGTGNVTTSTRKHNTAKHCKHIPPPETLSGPEHATNRIQGYCKPLEQEGRDDPIGYCKLSRWSIDYFSGTEKQAWQLGDLNSSLSFSLLDLFGRMLSSNELWTRFGSLAEFIILTLFFIYTLPFKSLELVQFVNVLSFLCSPRLHLFD